MHTTSSLVRAITLSTLAGLAVPALAANTTPAPTPTTARLLDLARHDAVNADGDAIVRTGDLADLPFVTEWAAPLLPTAMDRALRGSVAPEFIFTGSDPEGDNPAAAVYTPDGSTIVVAHRESKNLILWNADTFALTGWAEVSGFPQDVAVSPDGSTAVVACVDDVITIIDLDTMLEVATIPAAENPSAVLIAPSGDLALVALAASSQVVVVDLTTNTIVRTIDDIGFNQTFSFSPEPPAVSLQYSKPVLLDDDRILNADSGANEAQFINFRTGAVNRVSIAANAAGIGLSGDGSEAIITHRSSTRTLTRLDPATESVNGTLTVSADLQGPIALNTDATKAAIAIQNAGFVLDLTDFTAGPTLNTASVNQMLVAPDGQTALAVGFRGSVISFATETLVTDTNNQVSCEFGAMSPSENRAAMFSTTFGDDMVGVAVGTSGAGLETFQLSGPLAEGDRCRTIAISPDGTVAAGVSIFSDSLSVIEVLTGNIRGTAPLGLRPSAVAISPDGSTAVVGNLDSSFATVVDLATATSTDIAISTRAGSCVISPDSQYAYLGVVASGDGVWRINLNTLSVEGPKLLTGNMGGVGYSYSQSSPIFLSPDGSVLCVPGAFDNAVTLVDTATWTVTDTVSVGTFPTTAAFSPDGATLYVANKNDDTVSEIDMTLATPAVVDVIAVGDQPWQMIATDDALYVHDWNDERVRRIDRSTGNTTHTRALPTRGVSMDLDPSTGNIVVASGESSTMLGGTVGFSRTESGFVTAYSGDTLAIVSNTEFDQAPSAAAIGANGQIIALAAPTADGAVIINGRACPTDLNSNGENDIFDILAFLDLWNAMAPGSDFNNTGDVNIFDILSFLDAWNSGCP